MRKVEEKKREEKKKKGRLRAKHSRPGELEPRTTAMYLGYGNPSGNARAVQLQNRSRKRGPFRTWAEWRASKSSARLTRKAQD